METPQIIFEDYQIMVVHKPTGLMVERDRWQHPSVEDWALEYLMQKSKKPEAVKPGIVHRLDRPVSGLLLLAKTAKALSRLNAQMRDGNIQKEYLALVEGEQPTPEQTLIHWLLKDDSQKMALAFPVEVNGARKSVLHYTYQKSIGDTHLLHIQLHTGRFHQIRCQLAFVGHPIVGDTRYGSTHPLPEQQIRLHACSLSFEHPTTHERMQFHHQPEWAL